MYFGLQDGKHCFCGNEFGLHGRIHESNCGTQCANQCNNNCGGHLANAIYYNGVQFRKTDDGMHLSYESTQLHRSQLTSAWTMDGRCDHEAVKNGSALVNWMGTYKS